MIKFWKSAAKGKSGCPVRPPEQFNVKNENNSNSGAMGYRLETISEEEVSEPSTLSKKSRLSLSLKDVLEDRNALNYFLQYMESISKLPPIKFLLELENFKTSVILLKSTIHEREKLTRTKSFDSSQCSQEIANKLSVSRRHSCRFSNAHSSDNFKESDEEESDLNVEPAEGNASKYQRSVSEEEKLYQDKQNKNHHEFSKAITDEAINLFKRYVALEAPYKLDLPDNIRKIVISNICTPEGLVDEDCFRVAQDIIFKQLEDTCFDDFLKSPLYAKTQIDILTSGSLTLEDILYNEMTLFYFMEFLEQESCSILLEFLMAVMNFNDNLVNNTDSNPDQTQDDAIILYDKYFSLQATNPIGFSSEVRLNIEENICKEGGPPPTCFHTPFRVVMKTLSQYVKHFLESELYYKYLTEMINSVDHSWRSNNKKSLSDTSSEFSISTQNTLLAMGDPVYRKKKRNHSVPDMTIDSNQLYNGDSLWHRRKQEGLSLGRVNSLGRFESKFEPDPDKKKGSVLKKMVSRFVPNTTSAVEEEMAWQVAHMIVKDITDLTMAPSESQ